ncbi:MAG: efflux RND transporter periplasmic adaptor subunit [Flavobacteriaceae bacterium]|nr:efflux RND transporter periplasmic adaptor subunit [Flavobacteriaceae bacterium]
MKNKIKIYLLCLLTAFWFSCTESRENHENHNNQQIYYTCSMDPQVKEDKPGTCPICKMDLTAVSYEASPKNELALSEQQIKLGNIITQTISETQNSQAQDYVGILTLNQEEIFTIASVADGRIEKLYTKTPGEYIRANTPVYQLYSEDLALAKKDYMLAYQQLELPGDFGKNAQKLLQAARQKLVYYRLSEKQIESLKTGRDVSPTVTFYSDRSGYITEISASEGAYVMTGNPIISLADFKNLWLEVQVNVSDAQGLAFGQNARITFDEMPEKNYDGRISFINPEINPGTRMLMIRMELSNKGLDLKPGMQARARLTRSEIKGLFLPTDAVIREQKANFIWLEKRPGVFEVARVKTGIESNGQIEILSGLDPTKKVVVSGAYSLNSEYRFRNGSDSMKGM